MKCSKCKGEGEIDTNFPATETHLEFDAPVVCSRCDGRGELDIDLTRVTNIEFDGIDPKDRPDYSDAFIQSAEIDGRPLTDEELDELNEDRDFVHEKLLDL